MALFAVGRTSRALKSEDDSPACLPPFLSAVAGHLAYAKERKSYKSGCDVNDLGRVATRLIAGV